MKKLSILIAATSLLTQPVMADDIEIFTGGGSAGSENILLIMDTSRSMSEWANDTETPPYDNSEVYDGYGFEPNSVYLFNIDSIGDIEHLTTDEEVWGSNPYRVTNKKPTNLVGFFGYFY